MLLALGLSGLLPISLPMNAWIPVVGAAALLAAFLPERGVGCLPLLAFAVGGLWSTELESRRPPACLSDLDPGQRSLLRLVGTIHEGALSLDLMDEESWIVEMESLEAPKGRSSVAGFFRLKLKDQGGFFRPGDRIEAFGRWRPPAAPSNPHEIARDRREFRRTIWGRLECASNCVTLLARPRVSLRRLIHEMRVGALGLLRDRFPPDSAALAAPLLLGIWPRESQDSIDLFRRTGAIHLLAVSGMHVSLLFGAVTLGSLRRSRRRGILLAALIAFLSFYAALTGFQSPVLRAAIMLALSCTARALRRPCDGMSALGASAWIVCLLAPAEIEGPSFQLSFVATAGMILLGPALSSRFSSLLPSPLREKRPTQRITNAAGVSLAAFGSSLGIVLLHYRILPHASIPATLVATPFLAPLMLTGYALLIAPATTQTPLLWIFDSLQEITLFALRACEASLGPPIPLCGILWIFPAAIGLSLMLLAAKRAKRASLCALFLGCAGTFFPSWFRNAAPDALRIDILDAGHGNAIVLRTPSGHCYLFDAGSSSRPDLARSVLLPFLHAEGVQRIDRLLLSHGDSDHWNAVPGIWESIPISQVICGEGVRRQALSSLPRSAEETLLDASGPLRWESDGVQAFLWRAASEQCLTENDGSLSMLVRFGGRALLLCGDLEEDGIRALLESHEDWRCDLLLLPHHGLPSESLDDLLERTDPEWAIASCGRQFRTEGVAPPHWEKRFLSTAGSGAIRIEIERSGIWRLETNRGVGMMASRKSP